jgi:hypothetical protein
MRELLGFVLAFALAAAAGSAMIMTGHLTAAMPIVADYSGTTF